jgi:hypothetical protein
MRQQQIKTEDDQAVAEVDPLTSLAGSADFEPANIDDVIYNS